MRTAAQTVTGIISARIGVIALNGHADANPLLTMVPNGAGITVQALTLVQDLKLAARLTLARVDGARVLILAHLITGATIGRIYIHHPVTIVIDAVTHFHGRCQRITISQTSFGTSALPHASAKLIAHRAGSPKRQRH